MPFWHAARRIWIDVHSALIPRQYPLAADARFAWSTVRGQLVPIPIGGATGYVMNDELQLVYTCARWAERFDWRRGVFPMVDAALVIERCGSALDWERVIDWVRGSQAALGLALMLSWLDRNGVASVPADVLRRLAHREPRLHRLSKRLLHPLITTHIVEGRPAGVIPTEWHVQQLWSDLLLPRALAANVLGLSYHLLCPPRHPQRFNPMLAVQRLRSFARRAVRNRLVGTSGRSPRSQHADGHSNET
jgi:putative nucleotidyltransferase-like protein